MGICGGGLWEGNGMVYGMWDDGVGVYYRFVGGIWL